MKSIYAIILILIILPELKAQEFEFEHKLIPDVPQGSRGVAIADLDGNGFNDIVVANQVDSTLMSGNTIYFNELGSFRKEAIAANMLQAWSESVHTVDIDDDHDLDLFFTTQFGVPNLLYLNNGQGQFSRGDAGDLTRDNTNSPGACWCDVDLDGDLDVFVINRDGMDDQLYLNNGQGIFKRMLTGPWIGNKGDGRACSWGDLDGNGYPDLYVVNFVVKTDGKFSGKHKNYLYWNRGETGFETADSGILVEEENASYGVSLVDYDYDNDLDVYVTNVSVSDVNALYKNLGGGRFVKQVNSAVTYEVHRPSKGQSWGDFNNDGWLDLYVANGTEGYPEIQNFFFAGRPNEAFDRVYNTLPAIDGHISAGTANADLDNDGDLDLYVSNWGGEAEENDCYFNRSDKNNWVKFQLKGTVSNSYGIGSWLRLYLKDGGVQTRFFIRETGYGSQNSTEIHFGLGKAEEIVKIEILWPNGQVQAAYNLQPNRVYQCLEGKEITAIGK
ncbi:MAG: CRTAC1 family protein [Flavobacteriaceae bacterium]